MIAFAWVGGIAFIFSFSSPLTKRGAEACRGEEGEGFVGGSRCCGLGVFLESFDLSSFFLIDAKEMGSEIEEAGAEGPEDGGFGERDEARRRSVRDPGNPRVFC